MMSNKAAARLVIENMQMIEQARLLIEDELEPAFFKVVDSLVNERVGEFAGGWQGVFGWADGDEMQFAPEPWTASSNQADKFNYKNYYARYHLSLESSEGGVLDGNHWWLSSFFTNPNDRYVFQFSPWYANFGKLSSKLWRDFAGTKNQEYPQIEQAGFKFNAKSGRWHLPITRLDAAVVAENYVNDTLQDVFEPIINDALDKLLQAHPYFDKIIKSAIGKFGTAEAEA